MRSARAALNGSNVEGARLNNIDFRNTHFAPAETQSQIEIDHCDLSFASLNGDYRKCAFLRCKFDGSNCCSARFDEAVVVGSSFVGSLLQHARFNASNCTAVNFERADLFDADFSDADIAGANFLESIFTDVKLRNVKNAHLAKNLEKSIVPNEPNHHPRWFDLAQRRWFDKWCDWEMIRTAGRMQLFGASYFLMVYLITFIYVVGQYNEKLGAVKSWAAD
jgi:uncharacterized protein YjbI with pentapeptide repeats